METDKTETNSTENTTAAVKRDIFKRITEDDYIGVRELLVADSSEANKVDEHGMTPLEHTAYKGNKEMCLLLLDCGARTDAGQQNNGYTALHFAALSGNASLCQILLQHGFNAQALNSVGRTAAQMAAFVGNHHCASAISTFIDRLDVQYFVERPGLESTWHLKQILVAPIHGLLSHVNFHPVKLLQLVKQSDVLLNELPEVTKLLDLMLEREMKKGADARETVAIKLHLICHTLKEIEKESYREKGRDPLVLFIKKFMKREKPDEIPVKLDIFLREGVRSFQHRETAIMQQLVTNMTQTKVGEYPGAWDIICRLVNGQRGFQDADPCCVCGDETGIKRCSRCHSDAYCGTDCQKAHWFIHKQYCSADLSEKKQATSQN